MVSLAATGRVADPGIRARSVPPTAARIVAVASATPGNRLPQSELRAVAAGLLGEDHPTITVFDHARIASRSLAMPVEWYLEPHGHADRNAAYATVGLELVTRATKAALEQAGLEPTDIAAIVLVSTTGLATPSLDARLASRLGFAPDVLRLPVWGLGCAGGVGGLNRAAEWSRHLGKPVLLVAVELCSLSFDIEAALGLGGPHRSGGKACDGGATAERSPNAAPSNDKAATKKAVIAASLFGDGCAALILAPEPGGLQHVTGASYLFPGTERVMGWDVADHTLDVVLSPAIPDIVRREAKGLLDGFLAQVALAQVALAQADGKPLAFLPEVSQAVAVHASTGIPDASRPATSAAMVLVGPGVDPAGVGHRGPHQVIELPKPDAIAPQAITIHEWLLHPGGAKVIDAYRDALGLGDHELRHAEGVLRDHGNMSSPTVLFALQAHFETLQGRGASTSRATDRSPSNRTAVMAAWGPGFASEMAFLRWDGEPT